MPSKPELIEPAFDLENLAVTAGSDVACAHCCIGCGGTMPDGRSFQELNRVRCRAEERRYGVVDGQEEEEIVGAHNI